MKSKIIDVICIIVIFVGLWLLVSFVCVNIHNDPLHGDGEPGNWNAFVVASKASKALHHNRQSKELANHEETKAVIYRDPVTDYDLWLMAHLINGEAGADYCSDELMFYVGSVALNRVKSNLFPNTLEEVIFQSGQYACTTDGNFYIEPCERAWEIANDLLYEGSVLPDNIVFQSQFRQGSGVYLKEQNMYFCY